VAALLILLGALLVWMIGLFTAHPITVVIEGQRREVRTHQTTVGGVLAEAGVWIEAEDRINPPPETPLNNDLVITVDKAHPVLIEVDDNRRRILTHHTRLLDILSESGTELGENDQLFVDGAPQPPNTEIIPNTIRIVRARSVTIIEGDQVSEHATAAQTVAGVLTEAKIALVVADQVSPSLYAPVEAGMTIAITRAVPFTIEADGRILNTRAAAFSIGEALAQAGIALIGMDYTLPAPESALVEGMVVRVIRVTEADEIERGEIAFETLTQPVENLPANETRVIQEGMKGLWEMRVRVRFENGVEVSRSSPRETVIRPPREEIIAVGATPSIYQTETPVPNSP